MYTFSLEDEYQAMGYGVCQLLWVKHQLRNWGLKNVTIILHCDNTIQHRLILNLVQYTMHIHTILKLIVNLFMK